MMYQWMPPTTKRGFLLVTGLVLTCWFAGTGMAQESTIKDVLEAYDHEFLSSYSLQLTATYPLRFTNAEGDAARSVKITGDGSQQAMSLDRVQAFEPGETLSPRDISPPTTDENGNKMYVFIKKSFKYLAEAGGKSRDELEDVRVDEDNTVVSASMDMPPCINLYAADDVRITNEFHRFLVPLGRGYAALIGEIMSVTQDGDGSIIKVEATGSFSSVESGVWQLEIDKEKDYLVRRATFELGGNVMMVCESTDEYLGADVPISAGGTLRVSDDDVLTLSVSSYSQEVDGGLLELVTEKVNAVEPGARVADFSVMDSDRVPLTYEVDE